MSPPPTISVSVPLLSVCAPAGAAPPMSAHPLTLAGQAPGGISSVLLKMAKLLKVTGKVVFSLYESAAMPAITVAGRVSATVDPAMGVNVRLSVDQYAV